MKDTKAFRLANYRAHFELHEKQKALGINQDAALALLMHDDLRDPDATAERVQRDLDEALRDSPGLSL